MSESALEQLRTKPGIVLEFKQEGGYKIEVDTRGVLVYGCDCAAWLPRGMEDQLLEALLALKRHRKSEAKTRKG